MELRHLLYFTTLAETLNFHRAAARLNISQPPLTVAIQKLEKELGAALFVRNARGVSLTAAGEAALEFAQATLVQARNVQRAAREGSAGERGRLLVGFVGSAIYALLPKLIPLFRHRYPHVDLVLEEGTSAEIASRIRSQQLDVGLVRLPLLDIGRLDVKVIEIDELVIAISRSHALAERETVSLQMLASEPFILFSRVSVLRTTILTACRDAGFAPQVTQEAPQVHTILSLVESGLGVALVPSNATHYVPSGVRLLRLKHPTRIEIGMALAMETASVAARNFQALALEAYDIE